MVPYQDTTLYAPHKSPVPLQEDGYANFTLETMEQGKRKCKMALQKEMGLPINADIPMLGFIGRLDYQKVGGL